MSRVLTTRIAAALLAGLAVAAALAANDVARDRWWAVTAAQIADARGSGKAGVELAPGRVVTEPLAADDAWLLPLRWIAGGVAVGLAVLAVTGRRHGGGRKAQRGAIE